MFLFILLFLIIIFLSGITTIPISIPLVIVTAVLFKKSWVFSVALGLGLFLDLISMRVLGYTGLVFIIFVFLVRLYERKFETQTLTFIFFATLIGSFVYLSIFHYSNVLLQSFVDALLAILLFKFLWLRLDPHSETI